MNDDATDRDTWVSVRLPQRVRQKIGDIAKRENRRMTEQIRQFITEGIERRDKEHRNG